MDFADGSSFRWKVAACFLSRKPLKISNIRAGDEAPGATDAEVAFVRLAARLTRGSKVSVDKTGTVLHVTPGVLVGGNLGRVVVEAGSAGYLVCGLLALALFCKKRVYMRMEGCSTEDVVVMDRLLRTVLERFAVESDEFVFKTIKESLGGDGLVEFGCPIVRKSLAGVDARGELSEINRLRVTATVFNLTPQVSNDMVTHARSLLEDVCSDLVMASNKTPPSAERGYSISMCTETDADSTCVFGVSARCAKATPFTPQDPDSPRAITERCALMLLKKLAAKTTIDVQVLPLALLLSSMCTDGRFNFFNLGATLTDDVAEVLRVARAAAGVKFRLSKKNGLIEATCVGASVTNFYRTAA